MHFKANAWLSQWLTSGDATEHDLSGNLKKNFDARQKWATAYRLVAASNKLRSPTASTGSSSTSPTLSPDHPSGSGLSQGSHGGGGAITPLSGTSDEEAGGFVTAEEDRRCSAELHSWASRRSSGPRRDAVGEATGDGDKEQDIGGIPVIRRDHVDGPNSAVPSITVVTPEEPDTEAGKVTPDAEVEKVESHRPPEATRAGSADSASSLLRGMMGKLRLKSPV